MTGSGSARLRTAGVFVRIRQGAGAWSPRKRLGDEYWGGRADVAYAPDGTLGVLWASGFNTPTVTTLPPGGQWATPRVISKVKVNRLDLELAAGPGPRFAATWTSDESRQLRPGTHLRSHRRHDRPVGVPKPSGRPPAAAPVVTVKSDGTAVVMWLWRAPTTYDYAIQASVKPPNGAWEAPSTVRDVPADVSAYEVALASGPAGSLTAMWAEYDAADLATTYAVTEDPAAPDTGKIKGPKRIEPTKKGSFKFTGPAGATYECRVDKTRKQQDGTKETAGKKPVPWKACKSPYKVKAKKLKLGKHTVYVRAVQFGLADPTPSAAEVQGEVMSRRLLVTVLGAVLTLTGLTGLTSSTCPRRDLAPSGRGGPGHERLQLPVEPPRGRQARRHHRGRLVCLRRRPRRRYRRGRAPAGRVMGSSRRRLPPTHWA